jgi:hypothetical protein
MELFLDHDNTTNTTLVTADGVPRYKVETHRRHMGLRGDETEGVRKWFGMSDANVLTLGYGALSRLYRHCVLPFVLKRDFGDFYQKAVGDVISTR